MPSDRIDPPNDSPMTGAQRAYNYRRRRIAAGYRIVHGRLTLAPRRNATPREPPPHGHRRYMSRSNPCRCEVCRAAQIMYRANLRNRHAD